MKCLRVLPRLRGLPGFELLCQDGFGKALILLGAAKCLSYGIELRAEPGKDVEIRIIVVRKRPNMEALECRQLGILLVEPCFGVLQLRAEKLRRLFGELLPQLEIFFHEHRGDRGANLLGEARVIVDHADVKPWELPAFGPGHSADGRNTDRFAQTLD